MIEKPKEATQENLIKTIKREGKWISTLEENGSIWRTFDNKRTRYVLINDKIYSEMTL